jgi:hypothetical protein
MKNSSLTEDKAEQTPTGGVLVGKRQGQTIIHNKGTLSGYLVGKTHAEGGIKAVNKSTGQPLEMQGGEVVITAPAVSDNTKNEFNGKMMTNREILSTINEKGGGVSFAKGGDIPKNIKRTGASYKYGGKTMTDHEIYKKITGGHLAEGMTLSKIAKKHKVSLKELQKQVDLGMKAESEHTSSKREQMKIVKDHLFENPKYYTLLKRVGLKHGGAVRRGSLVRDAKSGNTPARDLNNYNDVLDMDADGMVGAETGLYARGGATDVVVDNWNDIPDAFKKIRLPKKIDWDEIPSDDGLNEIVKPFLNTNQYRKAQTGINFDDNGITVTDSHILLTIPTINKNYKGIYKKTKTGVEIINETYPLYPRIIANEKEITNVFYIDIVKLLTYCKVAKNYSGEREIVFKINNDFMAFFPDLMINFLSSLIKLTGNTQWNVSFNKTNKQGLLFTKYPSYELGRDIIGVIMPFVGDVYQYGTRNPDKNADLNVFFDFDNNEIVNTDGSTVDLDVKPTRQRAKKTTATTTASQTSVPTSKVLTKDELKDSKIWIDDDLDLRDKVMAKLIEIGIPEDAEYGSKGFTENLYIKIYGRDFVLWSDDKSHFDKDDRKEIFPADLGIDINNVGATPNATATTSGLYKDSEIKLFKEIDEIIESNNFDPLENPILDFSNTGRTKNFYLVDDENGEVFNLRAYNVSLGVQEEDTSKDRAKGLLKIYINWKSTQSTGGVSSTTINANNAIEVSRLTRNDLSNVKIWLGNNPELSEKIQKRAFELGLKWVDGDLRVTELDAPCLIFNGSGNQDNRIEKRASKSLFDNVNLEEIFVIDSTTTATPTSLPIDLTKTKIWIGKNNNALSKRIQEKAMELGWDWWGGSKNPVNLDFDNLFFDVNKKITSASDETAFDSFKDFREIDEADLFGNFNTTSTASQTSTQNALIEDEDWVKKFTADLDKLSTYLPNDIDFAPELSKEQKDLNALVKLLPSFQQSKYAIERAKILKEIKKLHYKLTYEGFIKPNEATSSDADLFTPQGLLDYYFTQATQNPTAELEPACELITPNGEKSKLPMSAYLNVRTEQFKNWFGDWEKAYETGNYVNCSKMIDPDTKEPKIYFHGVRKYVPNFGQFSNMGQGVVRPYGAFEPPSFPASYFAGDEDYAKFYGGVAENLPTPSADYKPFIYKVFLSVKNPISLLPLDFMLSYKDFMDYIYVGYGVKVEPNQELLKVLNNDLTKKNPMWIYVRRDIGFIEKLKDYGYDAIFQMGDIPTFLPSGEVEPDRTKHLQEVEYLTFYPNQVKSATVKKSFYFDFFNDIRFKNGGYVRI